MKRFVCQYDDKTVDANGRPRGVRFLVRYAETKEQAHMALERWFPGVTLESLHEETPEEQAKWINKSNTSRHDAQPSGRNYKPPTPKVKT